MLVFNDAVIEKNGQQEINPAAPGITDTHV